MHSPEHLLTQAVRAAQEGSPNAFAFVADGCRNYLLHVANREFPDLLRGKVAPSDVVQESLIAAHRNLANFRGTTLSDLRAWLRAILRNRLESHRRRFVSQKRCVLNEVSLDIGNTSVIACDIPDRSATPSQLMASQEELNRVIAALEKLPPHSRQVVLLRNRDGHSFNQIAEKMGRSPEAVRKLWARSIEQLRTLLED